MNETNGTSCHNVLILMHNMFYTTRWLDLVHDDKKTERKLKVKGKFCCATAYLYIWFFHDYFWFQR